MAYLIALSILVHSAATTWSVMLWRRLRDPRLGWLTAMLALLGIRQVASLWGFMMEPAGPTTPEVWGEAIASTITLVGVVAAYALGRMILDRDRAAAELDHAKTLQEALLRSIPDLMFRVARDGTYLDYIAQNDATLLVPPEKFLGRKIPEVLPEWMAEQCLRSLEQALATGRTQTFEYRGPRDPSHFWEVRTVSSGPDQVLMMVRDVTDRRKAEDSLRESESRFRSLADSAPVLIWMSGADGVATYYNATWLRYTGKTLEEELDGGWEVSLHPGDRERCLAEYERAFEHRAAYTLEYRLRRADGTYAWLLDQAVPRFTPEGAFAGFIGSATDISAQKAAEEALAERESRLRTIIQSEPECVALLDEDGRITEINPAGLAMLEAAGVDELQTRRLEDLCADSSRTALRGLTRTVFEGKEGALAFEVTGLRGSRRWLEIHAAPLRCGSGRVTSLLAIARDVTERRRAEEALRESDGRFRRLADHGAVGIWEITTDRRTLYANSAMCRMLEVDSPQELVSRDFDSFFTPESLRTIGRELERRARGEPSTYEVEIVGAMGGKRIAVVSGAPSPSPSRPLRSFLATFTDITDRKRLEDEVRQSEEFGRRIVETMPAGLVQVDVAGRIVRANAQAQRVLGLSMDAVTHRLVQDFQPETIREDGSPFPASEYPVRRCLTTGETAGPVMIGVRRPGDEQVGWAVYTAAPLHDPATGALAGAVVTFQDVTDRRAGEETLRQTAATLQAIIQTAPLAISTIDSHGKILAWNPAAERIFGWSAHEVLGQSLPIIPPGQETQFRQLLESELTGTSHLGIELVRQRRDGSLVDVELWTSPQRDASGRVVAALGMFADITERKRLQDELRESEERYRTLVEAAPIALFVNQNDRFVFANAEALRLYGAGSPDEILGTTVMDRVHPDFRAIVAERIRTVIKEGRAAAAMQIKHLRFDGSAIDVEVVGVPSTFNGRQAVQVVARDITEELREMERRRAAEQRDSLLIRQTPLAVIVWDMERRVVEWNPAAERIFGYTVAEAVGTPYELIVPPDVRPHLSQLWEDLIAGRGGTRSTNKNLTRDGRTILCDWYNTPLVGAGGKVVGVASLCQDVTDTKRLEDELRRAQKMEAIGQLASGVAHDFSNLLTAIFGFTSLARRTLSPQHPAVRSLDRVDAAAKQASGVTKALLTFSRGGTSEKKTVRLGQVVDDAVRLLRRTLPSNIDIKAVLDSRSPVYVRADATQLQQVVLNLAINARDAMKQGGRLTITVDSCPPDPGLTAENGERSAADTLARLTVTDTGTGMPPAVLARIFEPFFTTKPPGEGTGLGLAIIHGIVKDHEGNVQVQSEIGKGSTFTVTLPSASPEVQVTSSNGSAKALPTGRGELIVLADSHGYIRELIASMLLSLGYRVVQCTDGAALQEAYDQHRAEAKLLIIDADLPGWPGGEFLSQIRSAGDCIQVMLISPEINPLSPADDPRTRVLHKPFQMGELAATVSAALS